MRIKDLNGVLYNQRGYPIQMAVLWRFNENNIMEEYDSGAYEYLINKYPDMEVKRIQAEIISGEAVIVIETN